MTSWTYTTENEEGTVALGAALSGMSFNRVPMSPDGVPLSLAGVPLLPNGTVVALIGNLGAGKTRLVQAFCAAEGIDSRDVVSPTFVLLHEYRGRRPIFHFDAYRLKDDDEFLALGPEEYFDGSGVTFVEWADRVVDCLPRQRLEISIDVLGPTARKFTIQELGEPSSKIVERLAKVLGG